MNKILIEIYDSYRSSIKSIYINYYYHGEIIKAIILNKIMKDSIKYHSFLHLWAMIINNMKNVCKDE